MKKQYALLFLLSLMFYRCINKNYRFEQLRNEYDSFYKNDILQKQEGLSQYHKANYTVTVIDDDRESQIIGYLFKTPYGHNFEFKNKKLTLYQYYVDVFKSSYEVKFEGTKAIKGTPFVDALKSKLSDTLYLYFSTFMYDSLDVKVGTTKERFDTSLKLYNIDWMPYTLFSKYLPSKNLTYLNINCYCDGKLMVSYQDSLIR